MKPRYPVYVISKGRAKNCQTAKFLERDGTPFRLVVEPQEAEAYRPYGADKLIVTPFSNLGQGSIPVRNFVWEHAKAAGAECHWILDDNIQRIRRWYARERIPCDSGIALRCVEDFASRYENLAIAGLNYTMFCVYANEPIKINHHVYSCLLIRNDLPYRWRGRYNEDTDLCLQVLSGGWCTALVSAFMIDKTGTMTMKGGNTDELYKGDGRLKMARALERKWPGVVTVTRKFRRPQHHVRWEKFDTRLKLRPGVVIPKGADEYGMRLVSVRDVKSANLRRLVSDQVA